jgi:hypothetical protein
MNERTVHGGIDSGAVAVVFDFGEFRSGSVPP